MFKSVLTVRLVSLPNDPIRFEGRSYKSRERCEANAKQWRTRALRRHSRQHGRGRLRIDLEVVAA
jgi:hypothetical protein